MLSRVIGLNFIRRQTTHSSSNHHHHHATTSIRTVSSNPLLKSCSSKFRRITTANSTANSTVASNQTRMYHQYQQATSTRISTRTNIKVRDNLDNVNRMLAIMGVGCVTLVTNKNATSTATSCEESSASIENLEQEWESFMIQSMNPEEDDDDDEDDDDEDEEDTEEEEEEEEGKEQEDQDGGETEEETKEEREKEDSDDYVIVEIPTSSNETNDIQGNDLDSNGTTAADEDELNGNNNTNNKEETEIVTIESTATNEESKQVNEVEDPYDNLPEEDEPTSCTICLINRQGPCRSTWKKFEKCMKDNSSPENENEGNGSDDDQTQGGQKSAPSLADSCDKYMIPWIGCIQNYRNTYTLISNKYFQEELVDEIEKSIHDDEKVMLDNIDVSSIIKISNEWWSKGDDGSSNNRSSISEMKQDGELEVKDAVLVEGVARINLFDGDKPVEVAYVKDQNGTLLGYDQFTEFKKSLDSKENDNVNDTDGESSSSPSSAAGSTIGQCAFHVSPESTKSIQIYALYRSSSSSSSSSSSGNETSVSQSENKEDFASPTESESSDEEPKVTKEEEQKQAQKQTLYVSSPVIIDDLPKPLKENSTPTERNAAEKSD